MNKNFAKHLSGVLEGMEYSRAMQILDCLTDKVAALVHDIEELEGNEQYAIRFETMITMIDKFEMYDNKNSINLLEEYGIEGIYYRVAINPTEEEMIQFLEDYLGDEYESPDLYDDASSLIEREFYSYDYDEVLSYFADTKVEWDVVVSEDYNSFYRAGSNEVMHYWGE